MNENHSVGSKKIRITDNIDNIDFDTWLLYPCIRKSQSINIGPYRINACADAKIAKGKFALVIISHGGGGSLLLYRITAQYLAQKGYVVAMLEHYGNNRNDNSLEGKNKNLTLRTRHISDVIDTLLCHPELMKSINPLQIFMIGHSIGGGTALAISGAQPWSKCREKIEVSTENRIKALVLFAPATAWFQHPDSFNHVNLPILIFSAEHDLITPYWQAELIKQKVHFPARVTIKTVKNAGHLSFLAPFPARMNNTNFAASQDPEGFDRQAFHETLKEEVTAFFNKQQRD